MLTLANVCIFYPRWIYFGVELYSIKIFSSGLNLELELWVFLKHFFIILISFI